MATIIHRLCAVFGVLGLFVLGVSLFANRAHAGEPVPEDRAKWGLYAELVGTEWKHDEDIVRWTRAAQSDSIIQLDGLSRLRATIQPGPAPGQLKATFGYFRYVGTIEADGSVLWVTDGPLGRGRIRLKRNADGTLHEEWVRINKAGEVTKVVASHHMSPTSATGVAQAAEAPRGSLLSSAQPSVPAKPPVTTAPPGPASAPVAAVVPQQATPTPVAVAPQQAKPLTPPAPVAPDYTAQWGVLARMVGPTWHYQGYDDRLTVYYVWETPGVELKTITFDGVGRYRWHEGAVHVVQADGTLRKATIGPNGDYAFTNAAGTKFTLHWSGDHVIHEEVSAGGKKLRAVMERQAVPMRALDLERWYGLAHAARQANPYATDSVRRVRPLQLLGGRRDR